MENRSLPDLIITCEHAGYTIPDEYSETFIVDLPTLISHRGWDPGAYHLAGEIQKAHNTDLFHFPFTRLLIETNRSIGHPDLFSEYSDMLTAADKEKLITKYYLPYRNRIRDAIKSKISTGSRVVHLSVHTFTPSIHPARRTFDAGLLYDPSRQLEKDFCSYWKNAIQSLKSGAVIYMNRPYRGTSDGLTTMFRKQFPACRYLGIELEVNQKKLLKSMTFPVADINVLSISLKNALARIGS
jgi:predicted N-formylglutamate amidohydrolase